MQPGSARDAAATVSPTRMSSSRLSASVLTLPTTTIILSPLARLPRPSGCPASAPGENSAKSDELAVETWVGERSAPSGERHLRGVAGTLEGEHAQGVCELCRVTGDMHVSGTKRLRRGERSPCQAREGAKITVDHKRR